MRLVLAILALTLPAFAASSQTIRGAGARPCSDWNLARRDGGRDFEAEQWALGYVSGVTASLATKNVRQASVPDEKTLFADLDTACKAHADIMLWNALVTVIAAAHGA